jgi:hypothetical protein
MLVKTCLKRILNTVSGRSTQVDKDLMRHAQIEYGKDWQHAYYMLKAQAEAAVK